MALLWRLGPATINDIRAEQLRTKRRAYKTVQTALDRLVERGLLERERRGKPYVYRPRYDEAELLRGVFASSCHERDDLVLHDGHALLSRRRAGTLEPLLD
jgi:predicted transcriptional regulator